MDNSKFPRIKHTWTGTKTELVELIYAIYAKGSIDYGNIDINNSSLKFEYMATQP